MTATPATPATPNGVRIVRTTDPAAAATRLWAAAGSAIAPDVAAAMVVVAAPFGRNAVVDPMSPHVGIGRGHVRPFIAAAAMSCRVCRHHMTASAFPTLSVPTADGRTRNDRCRACRDARFGTHADYVAAGRPDRSRHIVAATVDAPAATSPRRARSTRTRTTAATPTPDATTGTTAPDAVTPDAPAATA